MAFEISDLSRDGMGGGAKERAREPDERTNRVGRVH